MAEYFAKISPTELRKTLSDKGAYISGNFFIGLKNGQVATEYINIDAVLNNPVITQRMGELLIIPYVRDCEVVVAPAVGAINLCFAAATYLRREMPCTHAMCVFTEQRDGREVFARQGFAETVRGKQVVIVEDITSTGNTLRSVIACVRAAGGHVLGASVVWNRIGLEAKSLDIPHLHSVITEFTRSYVPHKHKKWGEWPLVTDLGHPEHFPDYPGPKITLIDKISTPR